MPFLFRQSTYIASRPHLVSIAHFATLATNNSQGCLLYASCPASRPIKQGIPTIWYAFFAWIINMYRQSSPPREHSSLRHFGYKQLTGLFALRVVPRE